VKAASVAVVMRRAARVTVAASARIHATTVSSLRYLSLLCFPLLIKPRLGFCRSISRPIPARPQFPVRFPPPLEFPPVLLQFPPALNFSCDSRPPLEFPPALLESPRGTPMATASSPRTPSDAFRRPGRRHRHSGKARGTPTTPSTPRRLVVALRTMKIGGFD